MAGLGEGPWRVRSERVVVGECRICLFDVVVTIRRALAGRFSGR